MNLFDLTEGKVKKQTVNEGIEIVYEKVVAEENLNELSPKTLGSYINKANKDVGTLGYGLGDIKARPGKYKDSPETVKAVKHAFNKRIKGVEKATNRLTKQQGVAEDNQWHSDSSDQWHGQGGDAWHGATSDEWHGTGQGTGPATGMPAMKEADTAERLKRNLKKNGFDMDRFEAKIAEIERRNRELADEFYARHPELDDRIKDESATMFTSIGSDAGAGMGSATLGTDNDTSPVGSGTVDEGYDNEVGFGVNSEQAYNAVMTKFGDYIEHRDDGVMYAPRELWSAIEQTAFDADGVGAEEDSGLGVAEDQYGGGFGGGGIGPVTDSTSPVGGGGASVEEGLGAYDNDQGVKHTRGSLVAKLEALPRGSDDFEWNRQRAIQHLKQGNMVRAKYYMMLMKRGASVEEGSEEALQFATQAHAGQTRSGGDAYITHPMRVADHIRQYKQSHNLDALISAAYLHDTIEDTDTTQEVLHDLFGGLVASLVKELTSDPEQIKKVGKAAYLSHKMAVMSSYALVVKLADRLDNVKDITTTRTPQWRQKYKAETEHILDYIEKNRVLSGTHKKLIGLIRNKISELGNGPGVAEAKESDITEDIYESRIYKMKLAGYFD